MAHLVVAREALDRFVAELPAAGVLADRLRRIAETTRALIEQALASPDHQAAWIDHNLATLIAGGMDEDATRPAAATLFLGVRRRLSAALEADPDDLATALALALGAREGLDDPRIAEDVAMVAMALGRPQAGPRLVAAAVGLVVAAGEASDKAVAQAAAGVLGVVQSAAQATARRLPDHPDAALEVVKLELMSARAAEGSERARALDRVHGLLGDHERRFGPTAAARKLLAEVLALRARASAAGDDIRREAVQLIEAGARDRSLAPQQARKLVRAIERAGALDRDTAAHLTQVVETHAGEDLGAWREVLAVLLESSGEEGALLNLWERTLQDDPKSADAARGLFQRLVRNLRAGLATPYESGVLDRVLEAVPYGAMAKLGAQDVDLLIGRLRETFGTARAAAFVRDRLLATRDLRGREPLWGRALDLFEELGDEGELLEAARLATKHADSARGRLTVARKLLDRGEGLDEAAEALRPLLSAKGQAASEAHALSQRIGQHPALRDARKGALLSFEDRLGIGTAKKFKLRIVFTSRGWVLAEVVDQPAPDFYEHKHLRVMVRAEDLPQGVSPTDLRKGDHLMAPVRGTDADPSKDKEGLRVYWVADASAVSLEIDPKNLAKRWDKEEAAFGIGQDKLVPLKVWWDTRRKRLAARLLSEGGGREFQERPEVAPEQLPEAVDAERLGKGRRFWGRVERTGEDAEGRRGYRVAGKLETSAPAAEAAPEHPTPTEIAEDESGAPLPDQPTPVPGPQAGDARRPDEAQDESGATLEREEPAAKAGGGAPEHPLPTEIAEDESGAPLPGEPTPVPGPQAGDAKLPDVPQDESGAPLEETR